MNLRIAICDDEQEQQNITKQMLTRYSIHKDIDIQITLFLMERIYWRRLPIRRLFT